MPMQRPSPLDTPQNTNHTVNSAAQAAELQAIKSISQKTETPPLFPEALTPPAQSPTCCTYLRPCQLRQCYSTSRCRINPHVRGLHRKHCASRSFKSAMASRRPASNSPGNHVTPGTPSESCSSTTLVSRDVTAKPNGGHAPTFPAGQHPAPPALGFSLRKASAYQNPRQDAACGDAPAAVWAST